nr:MAG TPA: hypothetical protein [Crassvirales sp.]
MKVTGSNPVCASIINKLTYKLWLRNTTEIIVTQDLELQLQTS